MGWAVDDAAALDLSKAETDTLLRDVLHAGENRDYEALVPKVEELREKAHASTRDLLRFAVVLHNVRLHFTGPHAWALSGDLKDVVAQLRKYKFGSYCEALIEALEASGQACDGIATQGSKGGLLCDDCC